MHFLASRRQKIQSEYKDASGIVEWSTWGCAFTLIGFKVTTTTHCFWIQASVSNGTQNTACQWKIFTLILMQAQVSEAPQWQSLEGLQIWVHNKLEYSFNGTESWVAWAIVQSKGGGEGLECNKYLDLAANWQELTSPKSSPAAIFLWFSLGEVQSITKCLNFCHLQKVHGSQWELNQFVSYSEFMYQWFQ